MEQLTIPEREQEDIYCTLDQGNMTEVSEVMCDLTFKFEIQ